MILNKSAVERGLAHGTLFKCEAVDLREDKGKSQVPSSARCPLLIGSVQPCMHDPHCREAGMCPAVMMIGCMQS